MDNLGRVESDDRIWLSLSDFCNLAWPSLQLEVLLESVVSKYLALVQVSYLKLFS